MVRKNQRLRRTFPPAESVLHRELSRLGKAKQCTAQGESQTLHGSSGPPALKGEREVRNAECQEIWVSVCDQDVVDELPTGKHVMKGVIMS